MVRLTQDSVESEAIVLGSNDDYKVYESPTGELVVEDVNNQTRGFIKPEVNGEIGGDGRLVTALKNEEPMADDGETYPTIQAAENAASSWVFVPPGTYNENVTIDTDGLTLQGAGYNTTIDGGDGDALTIESNNVSVGNIAVQADASESGGGVRCIGDAGILTNIIVNTCGSNGIEITGRGGIVANCRITDSSVIIAIFCIYDNVIVTNNIVRNVGIGIYTNAGNNSSQHIIANNIIDSLTNYGMQVRDNNVIIGNRINNMPSEGIDISGNNTIVANNRVSDCGTNIADNGTGTTLDSNLTGPAN